MNRGGIEKFNSEQRKKYGKNFASRDGYETDYDKLFNERLNEFMNQSTFDFFKTNEHYQKSKELVDRYGMTQWDELARSNEAGIEELRKKLK